MPSSSGSGSSSGGGDTGRSSRLDLLHNALASGVAGFMQPIFFNPLDVLRLRYQSARTGTGSEGLLSFARRIVATEGALQGLYLPALPTNIAAVATTQAVRMGLYPDVRDAIVSWSSNGSTSTSNRKGPVAMAAAGLVSGALGYFLCAPLWLVKTKWQVAAQVRAEVMAEAKAAAAFSSSVPSSSSSSSSASAAEKAARAVVRRAEALPGTARGFWRGAGVMVVRGAALTAGQMLGYDGFKTAAKELHANFFSSSSRSSSESSRSSSTGNTQSTSSSGSSDAGGDDDVSGGNGSNANNDKGIGIDGPALHVAAAVVAGFAAATTSAPADVVMTRFQAAPPGKYPGGVAECAAALWREGAARYAPGGAAGSARAFFRGWTASFARLAPTFVFGITIYEQARRLLGLPYLT